MKNGPFVKKQESCPHCGGTIIQAFIRCPECHHKLKINCPSCGKLIQTDWIACPFCETKVDMK